MQQTPVNDPLNEEDLQLLETLVKSPVFRALRKLLGHYRDECQGQLMTEMNPQRIFEIRGRLLGINVIENLPQIRAHHYEQKKREESARKDAEERLKNHEFRKYPDRAPGKRKGST